jgi:hypothetical protein
MERGLIMLLHASIIGFGAYIVMVLGLGQTPHIAENRSVLLGAVVLVYMMLFGHGLPTKLNKHLF